MKRGTLGVLLFLLLFCVSAFAAVESVSLRVGESREIKGVNFTLLRTSQSDEKVVLCINNRKVIASDSSDYSIAIVKVRDVFERAANFDIEVACKDKCECKEDCNNSACFASEELPALQSCVSDAECDDSNPCTRDSCNNVVKRCTHEGVENCTIPQEPGSTPSPEQPTPAAKTIPVTELSTYMLLGIVLLLLIALIVKRLIR